MSTAPRTDRRIAKTRAALQGAMIRLLETTPFEAISIAQVTAEADVARPTFYQHYASTEALFAAIVDGITADVAAQIPDTDLEMPVENRVIMRHILAVWAAHAQALRVVVENGSRRVLVERFELGVRELLERTIRVNRLRRMRERDAAYTISFLANAAIGVFGCWSRRAFVETPGEIEALVAALVGPGVETLLVSRSKSS